MSKDFFQRVSDGALAIQSFSSQSRSPRVSTPYSGNTGSGAEVPAAKIAFSSLKAAADGTDGADGAIAGDGHDSSGIHLVSAENMVPQRIDWIWDGWLARGKIHVLAGAPGTGKTTLAVTWAAAISSGSQFPDGCRAKPGRVLIWSDEDSPADTLLPRLIAAGANRANIQFIGAVRDGAGTRPFDPAKDVDRLANANLHDVALIVVDPLVSAVACDSHKNSEVRRALAPLATLAEKLNVAVLGITHYSKATQGRDALERVNGSLAFGAIARVVLGVERVQGRTEVQETVVARIKSNIGPNSGGFAFNLTQVEIEGGVQTSKILWGEALQGEACDLFRSVGASTGSKVEKAAAWLRSLLADGPMKVADVSKAALEADLEWRTVQRAMDRACVISERQGFGGGATWRLRGASNECP